MNNLPLIFLVGWVVFSAIGVLFAKRIAVSAFALFSFLLGIAGIYAMLSLHMAVVAQLLIYVGGVMVLVAFALYLYPEPDAKPLLAEVRQSLGKAVIFLPLLALCYFFLPWQPLHEWVLRQNPDEFPPSDKGLWAVGQILATQYVVEFEWLGILMLAALVVGGWFIKKDADSVNR